MKTQGAKSKAAIRICDKESYMVSYSELFGFFFFKIDSIIVERPPKIRKPYKFLQSWTKNEILSNTELFTLILCLVLVLRLKTWNF